MACCVNVHESLYSKDVDPPPPKRAHPLAVVITQLGEREGAGLHLRIRNFEISSFEYSLVLGNINFKCCCAVIFPATGYLLLLIYSAANLCDRSWGTREQGSREDEGLWGWRVYITQAWKGMTSTRCCVHCFSSGSGEGTVEGGGAPKKEGEKIEAKEDGGGGVKGEGFVQEEDGARVSLEVSADGETAVEASNITDEEENTTDGQEEGSALGESCKYLSI
jgi:hypothetical protein